MISYIINLVFVYRRYFISLLIEIFSRKLMRKMNFDKIYLYFSGSLMDINYWIFYFKDLFFIVKW